MQGALLQTLCGFPSCGTAAPGTAGPELLTYHLHGVPHVDAERVIRQMRLQSASCCGRTLICRNCQSPLLIHRVGRVAACRGRRGGFMVISHAYTQTGGAAPVGLSHLATETMTIRDGLWTVGMTAVMTTGNGRDDNQQ